ncbi:cyclophilin-like fold protein [Maridesulfovibrio salexigens]|uniref:Cyclophilin-like domain-containing protein n=1 Tax=Maridesulfovibrio salexigens (strain ATCC 14822 / DSM 2638 / NCIMB 8403 / VKM B-1763) TaxID=526222 RepID=C6BTC7_MARSD|nr:cyclophilin-like fold protein [Maridesulfovibrio salexigens]ACS81608.1 hypothetical protein Desal_3562 [Maridesulfovibrio salexigens DSM 2638]
MLKLLLISLISIGSLAFASKCRAESKNDGKYASRTLENGTTVKLIVGETVIPALLNDSKSAQALIAKLPYTVELQRYAHDYCGVMSDGLPYDKSDLRDGWLDGDIAFAVSGNYFTILYKDEDISEQFDGIVNMGIIKAPLSIMDTLAESISLRIERD